MEQTGNVYENKGSRIRYLGFRIQEEKQRQSGCQLPDSSTGRLSTLEKADG
jgi:hypothetical protein